MAAPFEHDLAKFDAILESGARQGNQELVEGRLSLHLFHNAMGAARLIAGVVMNHLIQMSFRTTFGRRLKLAAWLARAAWKVVANG